MLAICWKRFCFQKEFYQSVSEKSIFSGLEKCDGNGFLRMSFWDSPSLGSAAIYMALLAVVTKTTVKNTKATNEDRRL